MRFIKYNITKGKSVSGSSVSGSSGITAPTVDLSDVYSRFSEDETRIGTLENQVNQLNSMTNGLESKYLRKDKSDNTDYTLSIGTALSNSFVSLDYDTTGIGFALVETGTASSNPNYKLILSGLGNGSTQLNCKSVLLDEPVMHYETALNLEITLNCNKSFSIATSTEGAYVLIDAGYTCGNNYTILEESLYMNYYLELTLRDSPELTDVILGAELEKQGNYWKVPLVTDGRNTNYNLNYVVKYSYIAPSGLAVAGLAINLYIKGTNTTTTDYYGGVSNKLEATPDYLQLTSNGAGIRITSLGIYRLDALGNMTLLL